MTTSADPAETLDALEHAVERARAVHRAAVSAAVRSVLPSAVVMDRCGDEVQIMDPETMKWAITVRYTRFGWDIASGFGMSSRHATLADAIDAHLSLAAQRFASGSIWSSRPAYEKLCRMLGATP